MKNKMYISISIVLLVLFCFTSCSEGYKKKNGKVFYKARNKAWGVINTKQIKNCDYNSFTKINKNYAKDKDKVYYRTKSIKNANPKTFQVIKNNFGRDENSVFYKSEELNNAKPTSFAVIDASYGKDEKNVFMGIDKLENANPNSFKTIKGTKYSNDNKHLYSNHYLIKGADPNSFELLKEPFFKDKNEVYYSIYPLGVCAVENFKILDFDEFGNRHWSTDGCFYYSTRYKVPSSNYKDVVYYEKTQFSKDKEHVYKMDKIYNYNEKNEKHFDIDVPSFTVDKFGKTKDKDGYFTFFERKEAYKINKNKVFIFNKEIKTSFEFSNRYNLNNDDYLKVENLIINYLKQNNLNYDNYYKQVFGFENNNSQKCLFINCLCEIEGYNNWTKNYLLVFDGGKCYFTLKINLDKEEIYDLEINGES